MTAGREDVVRVDGADASLWRVDGAGTPIVLVHSAGGSQRSFDALLPHLAGRNVIVPSFPRRGRSTGAHCVTATASAAWLAGLLRALDVPRAVVAGHSVGGAVAIELALSEHQGVLAGLALLSTGARLRVLPELLAALEQAVASDDAADLSRWIGADPARAHTPPASTLADWRMADGFDRMKDVSGIRAKTVILSGTTDPLTPPKYAVYLRNAIPGAELVSLEGAGHDLPVERPVDVAREIRRLASA